MQQTILHHVWRAACGALLILAFILPAAAQGPSGHLVPIGDGYSEVYAGFVKAAIANAKNNRVRIVVLPIGSASNSTFITEAERADRLKAADARRSEIETACQRDVPLDVTCQAILAPIFTRSDAVDSAMLQFFTPDVSAFFILGGDPMLAMQVVADTPLEDALTRAYQNGVVVGGTGAGGGILSVAMVAGYNPNFDTDHSLDFGAVNVWNTKQTRGLPFSINTAIVDTNFDQANRLGRLLNAIALPDVPHIGLGLDVNTGVNVYDGTRLQDVFGQSTVTILDAETFHAADAVRYRGANHTLSLHNVLVHTLAPGNFAYDLATRAITIENKALNLEPKIDRAFDTLTLPKNAGPLIIAGDLSQSLDHNPIIARFVEYAGSQQAKILIVVSGYSSDATAQTAAAEYAAALGVPAVTLAIPTREAGLHLPQPPDYTGILLIGRDQATFKTAQLDRWLKADWLSGKPILADDAAAAVLGTFYAAHGLTATVAISPTIAAESLLQGATTITNGLNLINAVFETQVMEENRWGQLFSLAYRHPEVIAFGLTQNSAIEITRDGARAFGDNAIIALDLRGAQLALGNNQAAVMANALLDVFAPGDEVKPTSADVNAQPTRAPTPVLPTFTPTPSLTPTRTPTASLTPTPLPTSTPTPLPTPTPAPVPLPPGPSGPIVPIAIGAAAVILLTVLLAARRTAR